jgi:asparagine synthase (glutamine-hydrolysing)
MKWMPRPVRAIFAKAIAATPVEFLNGSLPWLNSVTAKFGRAGTVGDKLHKFAEIMAMEKSEEFFHSLISHWKRPAQVVVGGQEPLAAYIDPRLHLDLPSFTQRMMYLDALIYLPDDILVKVDRASMGVSLESRVPLLDHRVVEFSWQLPLHMKLREGKSKWLLRQVLYQYVPAALIERDKMGFGVPIDTWLRGPLREWAEALLNEQRLQREGFFHPPMIRQKWQEHLSGQHEWHYYLWDVLMFQAWQEQWLQSSGSAQGR